MTPYEFVAGIVAVLLIPLLLESLLTTWAKR